jgi:hypothetical protein
MIKPILDGGKELEEVQVQDQLDIGLCCWKTSVLIFLFQSLKHIN